MTTISIEPMPESIRKIPKKWRPQHPPLSFFSDCGPGEPTKKDYQIALEIFEALDSESQDYWGGESTKAYLRRGIEGRDGGC